MPGEHRLPPLRQNGKAPVRKVLASTGGASLGALTAALVVGLLDDLVFRSGPVPGYLSAWLDVAVPAAGALAAGYMTPRAPGE